MNDTHCYLYHHLNQELYLAKVRTETANVERLAREISQHVAKCAECQGIHSTRPLEEQWFGRAVKVSKP